MTLQQTFTARRPDSRHRRSNRVIQGKRICQIPGCETILSRYNKNPECYQHAPLRYPRRPRSALLPEGE